MVISDKIIGNSNIYMFTWSGYIGIGLFGYVLRGLFGKLSIGKKIIGGVGFGIFASLFFYGWSNFGVWYLDSWGMYSKDMGGLIRCYVMGLPFLRNNLVGNLVFFPLGIFGVELLRSKELMKLIGFGIREINGKTR